MSRIRSIRTQLVVCLVLGFAVLEVAAGMGLYGYVDETLEHALDTALAAKAEQIAAAVHVEDDGQPHLLTSDALGMQSPHREGSFFFQIWRANGSSVARAGPPDDPHELPKILKAHKRFSDVRLASGLDCRAMQISITPRPDEDEFDPPVKKAPVSSEVLTLVVAHDRVAIDQPLNILLSGLSFMAVVVTVGIIAIVTWSVRRGLLPLGAVAKRVDQINASALDVRFAIESLPIELLPIGQKLNELMNRLQTAFERERRFSADVAHELRTPIAELRSMCEVSLRWPDQNQASEAVAESLVIAKQMESTVNSLLSLVRSQSGSELPRMQQLELFTIVKSLLEPLQPSAEAKGLTIDLKAMNAETIIQSDADLLSVVIRNLLANAVEYAPAKGNIGIELATESHSVYLRISNTNITLTDHDLPHLFGAFWRKDAARTDHNHQGLGLALVKEYCRILRIPIIATLTSGGLFQITMVIPLLAVNEN